MKFGEPKYDNRVEKHWEYHMKIIGQKERVTSRKRECLRCERTFLSYGAQNRMCLGCVGKDHAL